MTSRAKNLVARGGGGRWLFNLSIQAVVKNLFNTLPALEAFFTLEIRTTPVPMLTPAGVV